MTDILTTDKSIAAGTTIPERGSRANRILAVAIAATVAIAAVFVAVTLTDGSETAPIDRAAEANQLRWEGVAANATNLRASQTASRLRWEGLAAGATAIPPGRTADQLRWEGLAGISSSDRSLEAQTARWEGLAVAHGER